jgi:sec-independent protein translocase protein TatA
MELLLILIIVLIIFGAGKIPQLGEGLGKAIKGFKKSVNEADALDVTPSAENQTPPEGQGPPPQQVASGAQRQETMPGQPQYAPRQPEQKQG